jgi:hypothetical protein
MSPLLLVAIPAFATIIFGHPVPLISAGGTGLTVTQVQLPVTDQIVTFCDNSTVTLDIDDTLLLDDDIILPEGTICQVSFTLSSNASFSGTGNGGQFSLSLDVDTITIPVDPPLVVTSTTSDADAVRLAAPGWITASSLGLSQGVTVQVSPGHNLHNALAASVADDSRIVR